MPTFRTNRESIEIGTKADFIKLQAKHAVVGEDSEEIRKAVEKIEKIEPRMAEIRAYVAPHGELCKAVAKFKSKYAKKHPKFIAAVQADFVDPVEKIIEEGRDWIARASTLPKYYLEVLQPLDDLVKTLTDTKLDAAVLKAALLQLAAVGSTYNNATSNAKLIAEEFGIENIKKIAQAGEAKRSLIGAADRALQGIQKSQDYDANLVPVISALTEIAHTSKTLAAALGKASL